MGEETLDVGKFVSDYAANLESHIRVDRILLFGSYARGEATRDSDLDLIVVSPDFGEDILTDYTMAYRCLPDRVIDIDVKPCSPSKIAAVQPDTFLAYALKESKVVYENEAVASATR